VGSSHVISTCPSPFSFFPQSRNLMSAQTTLAVSFRETPPERISAYGLRCLELAPPPLPVTIHLLPCAIRWTAPLRLVLVAFRSLSALFCFGDFRMLYAGFKMGTFSNFLMQCVILVVFCPFFLHRRFVSPQQTTHGKLPTQRVPLSQMIRMVALLSIYP